MRARARVCVCVCVCVSVRVFYVDVVRVLCSPKYQEEEELVSQLVGALSPVNHKGLYQG